MAATVHTCGDDSARFPSEILVHLRHFAKVAKCLRDFLHVWQT